ncbi:DUF3631 domain-containing protein [Nocardia tengchongensis]
MTETERQSRDDAVVVLRGVLGEVRAHLDTYIYTADPDGDDSVILALWSAHTWAIEALYTSPRLLFDSPLPGSGKTTALEHVGRLSKARLSMASVSSPALIPRVLDKGPRTLLIDECDRSLSGKKNGIEDILAVINTGYKKGASRPVLVAKPDGSYDAAEMSTYAAVAMAGNSPELPADTRSRIVEILLLPANNGEVAETDWEDLDESVAALAVRLQQAVEALSDEFKGLAVELPAGLTGRRKEVWRPLMRVAVVAGGQWPADLARVIGKDMERLAAAIEDGLVYEKPHVVLIRDMHAVMGIEPFMPTANLIDALIVHNPSMWSEKTRNLTALTAKRLGLMLGKNYRVRSVQPARGAQRGYRPADLARAWASVGLTPHETSDARDVRDDPMRPVRITSSDSSDASRVPGGSGGLSERAARWFATPKDDGSTRCLARGEELAAGLGVTLGELTAELGPGDSSGCYRDVDMRSAA